MPSVPAHARKTKVVKAVNASALAASKVAKQQPMRRLRKANANPFKLQRVLRIFKESIKDATAEGGELHDLLLTLKDGASLKMRKSAGIAMYAYICEQEFLRLAVDAQILADHAKRLTVMPSDWSVLRRVKELKH